MREGGREGGKGGREEREGGREGGSRKCAGVCHSSFSQEEFNAHVCKEHIITKHIHLYMCMIHVHVDTFTATMLYIKYFPSFTFSLNSSCGRTESKTEESMACNSRMRSYRCSATSLSELLPTTRALLKNWNTEEEESDITRETR